MNELTTKGATATNFLLLARGESIGTARVVAVSADQSLVNRFIRELMGETDEGMKPDERSERSSVAGGEE